MVSKATIIFKAIVVIMRSEATAVSQQWSLFPLLQKCDSTMNPGHASCLGPMKNATDRQTDMDATA
jgi:hypothetical protein